MEQYTLPNTSNKATVHFNGTKKTLFSYDTKIAEYDTKTKKIEVFGWFSVTTGRHINAFFENLGEPKQTKKQLFETYNLKK